MLSTYIYVCITAATLLTIQLFPFAVFRIYNNTYEYVLIYVCTYVHWYRPQCASCWLVVQITVEVDILGASTVSCLRIKWSFDLSDIVASTLLTRCPPFGVVCMYSYICRFLCSLVIEGLGWHVICFPFTFCTYIPTYICTYVIVVHTVVAVAVASVGNLFSSRFHRL